MPREPPVTSAALLLKSDILPFLSVLANTTFASLANPTNAIGRHWVGEQYVRPYYKSSRKIRRTKFEWTTRFQAASALFLEAGLRRVFATDPTGPFERIRLLMHRP